MWPFGKSIDPEELYDQLNTIYKRINKWGGEIMADLQGLRDKIAEVEVAAAAEREQVAAGLAKVAEQAARIAELVAQQAPDLTPEVERLQAVVDSLRSDD